MVAFFVHHKTVKTTPIKILFLIQTPPPVHGASIMNCSVFEHFAQTPDYHCQLIPLDFARDLADLRVFRLGKVFKAIKIFFILSYKLITFRPSKVYFSIVPHGYVLLRDSIYLFTIKILRYRATPILHLHCPGLVEYRKKHNLDWFYRFLFRRCTIIHLTQDLLEKEIGTLSLKKVKNIVVHNIVQNYYRSNFHITRDRYNVLFLANLLPNKGYDLMVKAMAILKDKFPKISLSLAGAIPNRIIEDLLINLISELELYDRISVLGKVDGEMKQQLFEKASIFVLPSTLEYFPLTILEAMSNKLSVITSCRSSLSSIFEDKKHILYLDYLSPQAIADKIELLLVDDALREKISTEGFERCSEVQKNSIKILERIMKD